MIRQLSKYDFRVFPVLIIIIYVPFHILEEALNNFPDWMSTIYGLPIRLNYPHWLINNVFFFITLITGLILFFKNELKLHLGVGILIWAIMNSFEHIIGSFIFMKISPGLYSGLLFLIVSVIGIVKLVLEKKFNSKILVASLATAVLYWIIPIGFIVLTGKLWLKVLY